jgi:hypothetical protein
MAEKPDDVDQQTWDDYVAIRKAKRAPLTKTAWKRLMTEITKAGWTAEDALQECNARGWVGFSADWTKTRAEQNASARANQGASHSTISSDKVIEMAKKRDAREQAEWDAARARS